MRILTNAKIGKFLKKLKNLRRTKRGKILPKAASNQEKAKVAKFRGKSENRQKNKISTKT